MTEIYLEIVPRTKQQFLEEANIAKKYNISGINIPDIKKLENSNLTFLEYIQIYQKNIIPHIRARDYYRNPKDLYEKINKYNLNQILLISGDGNEKYDNKNTLKLIEKIKDKFDSIKIFGAIDQYRNSPEKELTYANSKILAGIDGFFTQPFFDINLIEDYLSQLKNYPIYFGICPVLNEKSKKYWENNNVCFPEEFNLNLDWNINFAKNFLSTLISLNQNTYLMPIKVDLELYLNKIFEH